MDNQLSIGDHHCDQSNVFKHTVLCIEDNPANLSLIEQVLKQRPVDFIIAHDPILGIELAQAYCPDLILLDINMPNMDGYEVLNIFKQNPKLKRIPVIAVTAKAAQMEIKHGITAGFADYITKPLDIRQFLHSIDQYLNK